MPTALDTDRAAFRQVTPFLVYCVVMVCIGELIFGLDGSAFSSFQILPSWLRVFGTRGKNGPYTLTTERRSLMTSIQWIGKLAGTIVVEPLVHRFGYKVALYVNCAVHFLGCILEISTHDWRVFSTGRVFQYMCVGIVENVGPTYIVESVPAALRAFFVVLIFTFQALGGVIMTGVFRGIANWDNAKSWYVPIAVQYAPGLLLLCGTPFIVESPRLLVAKGRKEEALKALQRLRRRSIPLEDHLMEIEEMEAGIDHQRTMAATSGWLEGVNLRRTTTAVMVLFIFNQWTGQQFVTSYAPTFYSMYGLKAKAFTYTLVARVISVVVSLPIGLCYDAMVDGR